MAPFILLAVGPEDVSGNVSMPAWVLVAAVLALVGAFITVGKLLLNEKDSKLALAREFANDQKADGEARIEAANAQTAEMKRLSGLLEAALLERDTIVKDGMASLSRIEIALARLGKP